MADPLDPVRSRRPGIEAAAFITFASLHAPGAVVALSQPTPLTTSALLAAVSVVMSLLLWACLAVLALRARRRAQLVPRGLLAIALAVDTVVLTVSGLSPPRLGNITAASVGLIAICAAAALLTSPRSLPAVVVPAITGQVVLLHAADTATTAARLVADVVTVTAASTATAALIVWLEHERRAGQAALARAALTDPLTGLLNRRGLSHELPSLMVPRTGGPARRRKNQRVEGRAAPDGGPATAGSGQRSAPAGVHVVVIDIDHFKTVNDVQGHDVGDEVLVLVAQALRDCSRRGDLLVRWGGEELTWVARWRTSRDAAAAAERLRVLVAERSRDVGVPVTISAGLAEVAKAHQGRDAEEFDVAGKMREALVLADRALYRAKAAGRDRVEVADGGLAAEAITASQ